MQNIYEGLEIEPPRVTMIEQIHLTARIVDPLHFVFLPERWEEQLKPFSRAKWKHGSWLGKPCDYEIKEGVFLVFPQFHMIQGGFYAAHLYQIVKNIPYDRVEGELTVEGMTLTCKLEGKIYQRVTLKPRGLSIKDTPYQAILR